MANVAVKSNGGGNAWLYSIVATTFTILINAFWAQAYSSIQADLTRLREDIKDKLTIREYILYKDTREGQINDIKYELAKVHEEQNRRSATVARVEALDKRLDAQARRLEDMSTSIFTIQTPGKAIDDIKKDVQELRQQIYVLPKLKDTTKP